MKVTDIKKCAYCKKGVAHCNGLLFYQVSIQRMGIDQRAIQRRTGLEMMLGSPTLAEVMGPDEEFVQPVGNKLELWVCDDCAMKHPLCAIEEVGRSE